MKLEVSHNHISDWNCLNHSLAMSTKICHRIACISGLVNSGQSPGKVRGVKRGHHVEALWENVRKKSQVHSGRINI